MSSSKKVCVVVGVGPGLGGSCAAKFAKEGYAVALMSRTKQRAESTIARIKKLGGDCSWISVDCSDQKSVEAGFSKVKQTFGSSPSVLIFNASGGYNPAEILDIDIKSFEKQWRVGCLGALLCTRQVLPGMIEAKSGTILFTSATAGFRGSRKMAAFAVEKFGLRALSQCVAKETASKGVHVCHMRIDCIIDSERARTQFGIPLEKLGDPDGMAQIYFDVHSQSRRAWVNELDIRPYTENWTY